MRGMQPPRPRPRPAPAPAPDDGYDYASASAGYTATDNGKKSPAHPPRKMPVSASFSQFTPAFDTPPGPSSTSKHQQQHHRPELPLSKIVQCPHPDVLRMGTVGIVPSRTPMHVHVLKPPLLREAVESQNQSPSKNSSPLSGRVPHPPPADTAQLTSMTSHLTSLKRAAVSHLASPKQHNVPQIAKKLVPIAPPTLAPAPPHALHETATPATSSHAERAEILAHSVRVSRAQQQPVDDVGLAELSRGLELSPQKHGRPHGGKKLVKSVPDLHKTLSWPDVYNEPLSLSLSLSGFYI